MKNPETEAKSETKRLFNTSGQHEALPDSGSHHLFNTLLAGGERVDQGGHGQALVFLQEVSAVLDRCIRLAFGARNPLSEPSIPALGDRILVRKGREKWTVETLQRRPYFHVGHPARITDIDRHQRGKPFAPALYDSSGKGAS